MLRQGDLDADQMAKLIQDRFTEVDNKMTELSDLGPLLGTVHTRKCPLQG